MRSHLNLILCLAVLIASIHGQKIVRSSQRIVGGEMVEIEEWPETVALLFSWDLEYYDHYCGGVVLNNRSVLTAAKCFTPSLELSRWRIRAGSFYASTGGTVYNVAEIIRHPEYNANSDDNDIAIMRTIDTIVFSDAVRPAALPSDNYIIHDDDIVYATGWGKVCEDGPTSEHFREVQIWIVNQYDCREAYGGLLTDNMLCAGWLGLGTRGQCQGDYGGPLYHDGVVVGIYSWGDGCARPFHPSVNTRLSRYTSWIRNNA